jgi:hypothetical protein
MNNILIFYQSQISYVYELLRNNELGDEVKAISNMWYCHFLMTQYDDHRWIKHSFVNEKIVQFLTQKLKLLMEKKFQDLIYHACEYLCSLQFV